MKGKPEFVVKESKFSARVKKRWRFPRGKHSAVRQYHKGRPALPTPGYGAPKSVKGLVFGKVPVIVSTLSDLKKLTDKDGAIISGGVGTKRKLELLKFAQDNKITVLNADSQKVMDAINKTMAERKKQRSERLASKEKKKVEKKVEKKEEKKSVEKTVEEETKKQKEMIEKTITKKQ